MTESNGARLAAVLPANSQFDIRTNSTPFLNSYPYEPSDAFGVENLKRIICKNTSIYVRRKEPACIVPTQPHCGLRKIICSERKKLGRPCYFRCGKRRTRQLDHRADQIRDLLPHAAQHALGHVFDHGALVLELLRGRDEWDHDLRHYPDAATHRAYRGLQYGAA